MPSLASAVSLLVAVSELKLVRSITRAINANLPKDGPLGTIRPSSAQLVARPRKYYSPTPAYRPGGAAYVANPAGVVDRRCDTYDRHCHPAGPVCPPAAPSCPPEPTTPLSPTDGVAYYRAAGFWTGHPGGPWTGPGVPPWRVLPPVREGRPAVRLQVVRRVADVPTGGTGLDCFG